MNDERNSSARLRVQPGVMQTCYWHRAIGRHGSYRQKKTPDRAGEHAAQALRADVGPVGGVVTGSHRAGVVGVQVASRSFEPSALP